MSYLPIDDKLRKMLPLFKQLTRYFPKAHREMTKVSVVNNVRYNPDRVPADINWARDKSKDQLGSAFHHMLEYAIDGKMFEAVPPDVAKATGIERVYILAEAAWRIHAELELAIERTEAEEAEAAKTPAPMACIHCGSTTTIEASNYPEKGSHFCRGSGDVLHPSRFFTPRGI